jgi:putative addiction module killer protein
MEKIKTKLYETESGREPFTDWFEDLDINIQAIILERLNRVRGGNTNACKPITGYSNLYEIVIDFGPGYRIYYSRITPVYFIILVGGEKKSQKRDIKKAYGYSIDYMRTQ